MYSKSDNNSITILTLLCLLLLIVRNKTDTTAISANTSPSIISDSFLQINLVMENISVIGING